MKTKLLKKIRKRFVIDYYPITKIYKVKGNYSFANEGKEFKNKQEAIDYILMQVKIMYCKYSYKHKQNKPIKVWYGK